MNTSSDRRRDTRFNVSPPCEIVSLGTRQPLEILNASYRGLFVRMETSPSIGELLKLRIELPDGAISLHGVPVRIIHDARGRAGVGLRFFALNGDDKRLWENYISSLLAPRQMAA